MRRFALALLLCACSPPAEGEPSPDPCPESRRGAPHLLADGFGGTEGIVFSPDGRLFVGDGDVLTEVQPDGSWAVVADVPAIIGLTFWNDRVIAATADSGDDDGLDGVFAVHPDSGAVERIGPGLLGANFVTVTPWGTLLVSDPGEEGILELTAEGAVSTWLPDLPSPNGTAFSEDGRSLWVATTYADPAPIRRIPVDAEGRPGAPETVAEFEAGVVPDGVAVGASGALYVAQILAGRVDVIQEDGAVRTLAAGVGSPASLAFGLGPAWDACSVYSTSLFSDELYRVEVGERGLPLR